MDNRLKYFSSSQEVKITKLIEDCSQILKNPTESSEQLKETQL